MRLARSGELDAPPGKEGSSSLKDG